MPVSFLSAPAPRGLTTHQFGRAITLRKMSALAERMRSESSPRILKGGSDIRNQAWRPGRNKGAGLGKISAESGEGLVRLRQGRDLVVAFQDIILIGRNRSLAFNHQPAPVTIDNVLDDGQSEAGAQPVSTLLAFDAIKTLRQSRQKFALDAWAFVAHGRCVQAEMVRGSPII